MSVAGDLPQGSGEAGSGHGYDADVLAVMEFFKANGVQESQITMRFHGERYPVAPNNSAANRAKNRRVAVRLERVAPTEKATPQVAPQITAPGSTSATS